MKLQSVDQEAALETGFALLVVGFMTGLAVLVFGRVMGGAQRGKRHAEGAPSLGSVPPERHQNLSSSPR